MEGPSSGFLLMLSVVFIYASVLHFNSELNILNGQVAKLFVSLELFSPEIKTPNVFLLNVSVIAA